MALEYLPHGDLRSYLRANFSPSNTETTLESTQLVKFALDVAKGMKHLAASGVMPSFVVIQSTWLVITSF